MKRAFIVCGAEHSGNRLVAGLLASGGCWGRGSDDQPTRPEVAEAAPDRVVVIAHLEDDLRAWHASFQDAGRETHFILTARDPWVQVRSRSAAAGCRLEDSMVRYRSDYSAAFRVISEYLKECGLTVITRNAAL